MFQNLAADIESLYEKKPIIIIHDKSQERDLLKIVMNHKYRYLIGVAQETLATAR